MKIQKFNEQLSKDNELDIINEIDHLIKDEVITRDVPWTENDQELDPDTTLDAAKRIFNMLKDKKVNFEILSDTDKYNL